MAATDPCLLAPWGGGPQGMTVSTPVVAGGYRRRVASVTLSLLASDVARRTGAQGQDAWVVVRVRGQRPMFPILPEGALDDANLDAVVAAATPAATWTAIGDKGVPAAAFTAPVLVDFDGGGYRAPFAP